LPAVAGIYQNPYEFDVPALVMMNPFKLHNGSVIATYIWQWFNHD
jgi:hypothetical protein